MIGWTAWARRIVCRRGFGKPEVLHLAGANQFFDGTGDVFDWHLGIDAVLIEQIDRFDPEAFQRRFGDLLDMFGAAVQAVLLALRVNFETEFCGDDHVSAEWRQGFAHQDFIRKWAVISAVSKNVMPCSTAARITAIMACFSTPHLAASHPHAAESDRRDFKITVSKFSFLSFLISGLSAVAFCFEGQWK